MRTSAVVRRGLYSSEERDWFFSYVSDAAIGTTSSAYEDLKEIVPIPFSGWDFWTVASDGELEDAFGQLREHIDAGGFVVVIAPPGSARTALLEGLAPMRTVEDFRKLAPRNSPAWRYDLPSGTFAIDDTSRHDRTEVARIIDISMVNNLGFALAFQDRDDFRAFEIAAYLATSKVIVVELPAADAA